MHNRKDLSTDQAIAMLRFLKEQGCKKLSLLGGEPLCRPDFIELLHELKNVDIPTQITTNGTLLSEKIIKEILDSPINILNISLDGGNREANDAIRGAGTFEIVTNNINRLVKMKQQAGKDLTITIGYVVTMSNYLSSNDIIDLCKKHGIRRLCASSLMLSGNAVGNWDKIKINQRKLLETVEEMANYTQKNYPSLVFQVDARPLMVHYLKMRYGIDVIYNLEYTKCSFLDGQIYIEADGTCHPCGVYAMEVGKKAIEHGYFSPKDADNIKDIKDISEVFSTEYFKEFSTGMRQLEAIPAMQYCERCEKRNDCYLCPYQREGDIVDCLYAREQIDKYIENLSNVYIEKVIAVDAAWLNEKEEKAYSLLVPGKTVKDNYELCAQIYDCSLEDYLYALNSLEHKFIIKRGSCCEN